MSVSESIAVCSMKETPRPLTVSAMIDLRPSRMGGASLQRGREGIEVVTVAALDMPAEAPNLASRSPRSLVWLTR